jgi:hypothetical protein
MESRSARKPGILTVQLSDVADTVAELTGATATEALHDRPTARWRVVDVNLLEHVAECIFGAGLILNSRAGSVSIAERVDAAVIELDEALRALADAVFRTHDVRSESDRVRGGSEFVDQ